MKTIETNPTAYIAINKSRLKIYGKNSNLPVYYMTKGTQFQIELFNPTKDTIMAKISLNGKPIAQGGLVLKPAQRVFLDRYIDVARKFKFDTYEVSNTSESRKAIEYNGDFKVEFYKEYTPINNIPYYGDIYLYNSGIPYYGGTVNTTNGICGTVNTTLTTNFNNVVGTIDFSRELEIRTPNDLRRRSLKSKKSIETGRVEAGSHSEQTLETVYMNWEYLPFHSIEYKMLPISQKVNTVEDTQVKRYCTNCGSKNKSNFKFCPICGTQV